MIDHRAPGYGGRMGEATSTPRTHYTPAITAVHCPFCRVVIGAMETENGFRTVFGTAAPLDWETLQTKGVLRGV